MTAFRSSVPGRGPIPTRPPGKNSVPSFEPIPDAELRPTDTYLKIGRWLDQHWPKVESAHRWITDTTYDTWPSGTHSPICSITWCWDCGLERSEAPRRCTHAARNRHEYTFAHNRANGRRTS